MLLKSVFSSSLSHGCTLKSSKARRAVSMRYQALKELGPELAKTKTELVKSLADLLSSSSAMGDRQIAMVSN